MELLLSSIDTLLRRGLQLPNACVDKYLLEHAVLDVACFRVLLSKLLSLGIVTGAVVVKLPQILTIALSGKADALAPSMFVLENVGYTISAAYNYRHGYAFLTYGESVFLLLQGIVLVLLIYGIKRQLNLVFALSSLLFAAFVFSCFVWLPLISLDTLQTLCIPLFAASRLPQIYNNHVLKNTGQLSLITSVLNAAGSAARIFTTLQEGINDSLILFGTCVSTVLNCVILLQMVLYWSATNKLKKASTSTKHGKVPATASNDHAAAQDAEPLASRLRKRKIK